MGVWPVSQPSRELKGQQPRWILFDETLMQFRSNFWLETVERDAAHSMNETLEAKGKNQLTIEIIYCWMNQIRPYFIIR
jgi:hypothetical protein